MAWKYVWKHTRLSYSTIELHDFIVACGHRVYEGAGLAQK